MRLDLLAQISCACEHNGCCVDDWKHVVWSDESPFVLQNQSAEFCWRINKEKEHCRSMQGTFKHQNQLMLGDVFHGMVCA